MDHFDYHKNHIQLNHFCLGTAETGFTDGSIATNDDKTEAFGFTGEIFSYDGEDLINQNHASFLLSLIRSDKKMSFLSKLNGHFSACYYNSHENELILISDRFGTHPLFYGLFNGNLYFASEVKSVLEAPVKREVDWEGVSHLFHYTHLFGYKTLFKGITQLPEASYLIFKNNGLSIHRYWNYPEHEDIYSRENYSFRQIRSYSDELEFKLGNAMRRVMLSKSDKILFSLSGGLDSRYVVAWAAKSGIKPLAAYTMGSANSDDVIYSKQVSELLHIEQSIFEINPENIWRDAERFSYVADNMSIINGPTQGFSILESFYGKYHYTISSQMCDAFFGSTLWRNRIKTLIRKEQFDDEAKHILYNIYHIIPEEYLITAFTKDTYNLIKNRHTVIIDKYLHSSKRPYHAYFLLLINEHGRRGTLCGNLMNNLFMETRMPSYDNDLVDFAFRLPLKLKYHQFLYRKVFSDLFPRLANIRREYYNLPIDATNFEFAIRTFEKKVLNKLKTTPLRGIVSLFPGLNRPTYIHYNKWFKEDLNRQVKDILTDNRTLNRGFYDKDGIIRLYHTHITSKQDLSPVLWQLVNFEYFCRNFLD